MRAVQSRAYLAPAYRGVPSGYLFAHLRNAAVILLTSTAVLAQSESTLAPRLSLPELPPLYTKALRFTNEVRLRVESPDVVYQVSDQLLLFDVNAEYFIGVRRDEVNKVNELVAFPRINEVGEGTAWITNEKQLIFGSRTRSCNGVLMVRRGETLPILHEGSQTVTVLFERFGREVMMTLPRLNGNSLIEAATPPAELFMAHERAAEAARAAAAAQMQPVRQSSTQVLPASIARAAREGTRSPAPAPSPTPVRSNSTLALSVNEIPSGAVVRVTTTPPPPKPVLVATPPAAPVPAPPPAVVATPPTVPPVVAAPATAALIAAAADQPVPIRTPTDLVEVAAAVLPTTAPPVAVAAALRPPASNVVAAALTDATTGLVVAAAGATGAAPALVMSVVTTASRSATAAQPPASEQSEPSSIASLLTFNSLTFWLLLATVALEGAMIARLVLKKKAAVTGSDLPNQVFSFSSVGESVMDTSPESFVTGTDGDLQGELEKFSIGHVVQFLHSSSESGTLVISGAAGRTDKLIFDRGQIIDAMSGSRCGDAAAEIVLRRRQGAFKFTREDNSKRLRLISQDTMGMLMEAARVIDEKGWAE